MGAKKRMTSKSVGWGLLTENERLVMAYLFFRGGPAHLSEIQDECFGQLESGTSMSRNTVRRLFDCKVIRRTGPGRYAATAKGRRMVANEALDVDQGDELRIAG